MSDEQDSVRTTAQLIFPSVLVFAAAQIVNAHDHPGEGFSAGLLVALSILLLHVSVGKRAVEADVPAALRWAFPAGVALLLATAAAGPVLGHPLLTVWSRDVGLLGTSVHLSSTLLLDLSIFLIVGGGTHRLLREVSP